MQKQSDGAQKKCILTLCRAENLESLVKFVFASFTDPLFSLWKLPGPRPANLIAIYLIPEATTFFRSHLTEYIKEQAKCACYCGFLPH